jgi:hypothetical protein
VKAWKLLLPVPIVAALAMVPQDPQNADPSLTEQAVVVSISDLQYVNLQGTAHTVTARSVVEIRLIEDQGQHIRLELTYDNGDYSLIEAQTFHLLRTGQSSREVKLVRCKPARMRFPRIVGP